MARTVASIDLRRLWEPRGSTPARTAVLDDRKACRKRVKRSLKELQPQTSERAARTRTWIKSKCGRCVRCPKMMAEWDIKPLPTLRL